MRTYYIYKATNKVNGKAYVGQTNNWRSRIWQHMRCYEKEDCLFHDAIKEYGIDNFEWELLETCNNRKQALELEKHYIELYDTYRNGYNENKGGVGWHNARPVVCLDKDGNFVKRYDSAMDAEHQDGFTNSTVLLCCKNLALTCKNHLFMFESDYLNGETKRYQKPESACNRPVIQCSADGKFIAKYKSVSEAALKTGANRTTISGVLTNTYKLAKGYIFVYEEDYPIKDLDLYRQGQKGIKVSQIDIESGKVLNTFKNVAEAGRRLGVNHKPIYKVINKPDRTAYGFKWISQ